MAGFPMGFPWMNMQGGGPYSVDDPGLSLDPNFTTVMLRNIPNKYTTKMLLNVLDRRFAKQYDYVYLPVDFVNHCNVGYAFVNLKSAETRARFYRHFHNQKVKEVLPGFNSKKVLKQVCEVNKAKVQGAKENIRRIKQMSMLMQRLKDHPDWVPLLFDQNGTAIPLDLDAPVEPALPKPARKPFQFPTGPPPAMQQGGWGEPHHHPMGPAAPPMPAYGFNPYSDPFTQHMLLQQQAQAAYNVAVASATAAAVSAASSPSDYMTAEDWYGNKENSGNAWNQPTNGMAKPMGKPYWDPSNATENSYPLAYHQYQ